MFYRGKIPFIAVGYGANTPLIHAREMCESQLPRFSKQALLPDIEDHRSREALALHMHRITDDFLFRDPGRRQCRPVTSDDPQLDPT